MRHPVPWSPQWSLGRRSILAVVAGAVAAMGLAPLGLWPMTLLGVACLPALLFMARSLRQAVLMGWAFGAGWFVHALLWIIEPFLVDVARHGWMAPFALLFMSGGLALFWGAAAGLAWRAGRRPMSRGVALIFALTLAELARGYVLTGFPWAAPAQVWVGTPVALLLAWIGPHGLTFVTLAVAMLPGVTLALRLPMRRAVIAALPALALVTAAMTAQARAPQVESTGQVVRLVQPNAPQHLKWHPDYALEFFNRQLTFTRASGDTPRPDLIVWPETSVPALLEQADAAMAAMAEAAGGVPLVFGIQRSEGLRAFNSLVVLDGQGAIATIYDKHHLVPFGEYIPLGDLAAGLGLRGFAAREGDGYSPGPGPRVLDLPGIGRALPLICYEAVFPQDVNAAPERPELLLQITNDAWFGAHSGPYQHLAQARMRAIEQGLPMVRVANTGVSAMIDPLGRITRALPLGEAGLLDATLPAPLPPTLYARLGDGPVLAMIFGLGLALWAMRRQRRVFRG
ncbi:MAG TPA: apolipoprotein N-acyltransferase [Rhodobacteraceae bacterium]|nr:apolipoprotein N-acyltransferase [Paracoccaceae bacterium]